MEDKIRKILEENVGLIGRMISGSKSGYIRTNPDNFVVFNANICTANQKVWWGDLDLTTSKGALISTAIAIDEDIYVFYEMDARFEMEDKFKLTDAVAIFHADGTYEVGKKCKHYQKL